MPTAASTQPQNLPRILCLHGGGTNARIFRAQCRVIVSHLRGSFRLVFADAPLPSVPGPDVTSVYESWGPFRAWLPPSFIDGVPDGQSAELAVAVVEDAIESAMREDDLVHTGPWVGLLGFSQGAKMAASLLLRQQQLAKAGHASRFEFQFGVLLAGRGPLITLDGEADGELHFHATPPWNTKPVTTSSIVFGIPVDEVEGVQEDKKSLHVSVSKLPSDILTLPTLHIHGLRDPGLQLHRRMMNDWCEPSSTRLLQWDGAHRVPIKVEHVFQIVHHMKSMLKDSRF